MLEVHVTGKTVEALGICSFELRAIDGGPLPAFEAGAHVDVYIAPGLTRQYSLCNDPHERHRYLIGVLRDPASRGGSNALHDTLHVGQTLTIGTPRNLFALAQSGTRHVLLGGGIGITPMLAMAHELHHRGADFELHYCFRSRDRAAFIPTLEQGAFARHLYLHDDNGAAGQKLDAPALLGTPTSGSHLYVCGPGGFMQHILDTARSAGWPEAQVHREFFAATATDPATNTAFEIELASSGRVLCVPPERTVFEVLDEAGVMIDSSCEQGVCGTCMTRVLAGIPDHRDQFLTPAEQAANDCFLPCCSRARSTRLVLDL